MEIEQSSPPRLRHSSIAAFFAFRLLGKPVTIPASPLISSIAIAPQLSAHFTCGTAGFDTSGIGAVREDGPHCALPPETPWGPDVCAITGLPIHASTRTLSKVVVISPPYRLEVPSRFFYPILIQPSNPRL